MPTDPNITQHELEATGTSSGNATASTEQHASTESGSGQPPTSQPSPTQVRRRPSALMPDKPDASRARKAKAKARRNWKPIFLLAFKEHGTVTAACETAGIARATAYEARRDEEFAVAWDQIEAETTDAMEREAYRRAVEGVEKPLVSAGKLVTTAREFSDGLMMFMLKARRPETYRENVKVEHAGTVKHGQALDLSKLSDRELAQLEQLTAKAA